MIAHYTEGEGDGFESRLPFKIFSTLTTMREKNKIDRVYMKRQFVRKLWGEIFEMTSNALPFSGEKAILLIYPGRGI